MTKSEFIQRLHELAVELGVDVSEIVVSGGGALLILGLRTSTADMDLDVAVEVYERFKTPDNVQHFGLVTIVNYTDTISLHVLPEEITTMVVDGVTIYSIHSLIAQKFMLFASPYRKPEKLSMDLDDLTNLYTLLR